MFIIYFLYLMNLGYFCFVGFLYNGLDFWGGGEVDDFGVGFISELLEFFSFEEGRVVFHIGIDNLLYFIYAQ